MGAFLGSTVGLLLIAGLVLLFIILRYYRQCPSNKILVVYGSVGGGRSAKCIHGGGTFVIPVLQGFQYMSLLPLSIEIKLSGALSAENIRVNVPSTFTVGISTEPEIMQNAAERLLGLGEDQIKAQAEEIILGQLRLVIATLTIEEINKDREKFLSKVNTNVATELHKIGLQLINVNVRDITDESGYIEAIGKKSAAEAINKAKVEVAEQERIGAVGEARAVRARNVEVANENAEMEKGAKEAEKNKRMTLSQLETEAAIAESKAERERNIEIANQKSETDIGLKRAEAQRRTITAETEAAATEKENASKALIAESNATLAERNAAARQRSEVAQAQAETEILKAERERQMAKLQKEEVVRQEIEKTKRELEAEAEAETRRRIAKGEADAILQKYQAEAEGLQKLLQAKAQGYRDIIHATGDDPKIAATLLLIEKMETLVSKQVEAISNLKIEKITVWDTGTGNGNGSTTSKFLQSFISALPPLQEIARQTGIELPSYLGSLKEVEPALTDREDRK